ncbi:MAG: (2,3-dihydroxybenzoyl)adenylate synthase [Lysobacter sp.]
MSAASSDFTPWPEVFAARYRALGYWTGQTLYGRLHEVAARQPDRPALVCGTRRWSYAQLDAQVLRLAAGLARLGIGGGDRVLLQLPNIAEFHLTCFALFRLGALPVFALPAHRRAEIGYFVEHTQARACVIADREMGFDHRALMREVQAAHPCLREVIVVGEAQELRAFDALDDADGVAGSALDLPPPPQPGDVAFLQLSGGSTGVPKLIPRTHDDYLYSIRESVRICGFDTETVYLCVLPAAHNFPMSSPGAFGAFHAGGCVVLARHPEPVRCFALIEAERASATALVPALALAWLDSPARARHDLASLRLLQVGGAHLAPVVARRLRASFGATLQQVFGMAEGLVNYTRLDDPDELAVASQGRPISADDEIRIVDDRDRPVARGEVGHLLTRGPYTIRGYYRADAHNATAFTVEGFYRTGDRVRQLSSGHLVVVGRAKDQVNRGGDKIAAEEVEAHLLTHPQVFDAALVAMPDVRLGEKACAYVVARDAGLDARALQRFLRERAIADYKVPERIEFVDALPRTAVGKVDKRRLRARIAEAIAMPTPSPEPVAEAQP